MSLTPDIPLSISVVNVSGTEPPSCTVGLVDLAWDDVGSVLVFFILATIAVLVVLGNTLVIVAVFVSNKLRTVPNLFIVSLAVADLTLGILVLPFSAISEVFTVWVFGDIMCSVWLAVDVWMCTSSILNLCAISLDRFIAVTRPVQYPSIMSSFRVKSLIGTVWILSFIICFPPLVGWNDKADSNLIDYIVKDENNSTNFVNATCKEQTCELTNTRGYVVYSALGSFFIPTCVMLFFYWRIYLSAAATTKAINQGFRTTSSGGKQRNRFEEDRVTLRIHRGRGTAHSDSSAAGQKWRQNGVCHRNKLEGQHAHGKVETTINLSESVPFYQKRTLSQRHSVETMTSSSAEVTLDPNQPVLSQKPSKRERRGSDNNNQAEAAFSRRRQVSKMSKRNIKAQVKRFKMETKAAKTLGIIVGCFIVCWLPFFTMYLTRTFCEDCISPLLFSILFWLGYCNSALNPCIYALFSRDFRFAFKKILCKCKWRRETHMSSLSLPVPAILLNSYGDDSDELQDKNQVLTTAS